MRKQWTTDELIDVLADHWDACVRDYGFEMLVNHPDAYFAICRLAVARQIEHEMRAERLRKPLPQPARRWWSWRRTPLLPPAGGGYTATSQPSGRSNRAAPVPPTGRGAATARTR